MNIQMMALFDKKARAFKTPWFAAHVELGVRAVADAANNAPEMDIYKFPEDFSVYHLGTFNDENGQMILAAQPIIVCEALSLKKESHVQR